MSSALPTAIPPRRSPWPPRYFVAECTTTSAPSSTGRCSAGEAKVLSTTVTALAARAMAAIRATSMTRRLGLAGVSKNTILVFPFSSGSRVSGRVRSASRTVIPKRLRPRVKKAKELP